ncbi:LuxR family transcriptional regulator [Xylanimonas oleitrophica]|uniref:LuxR family transcriptional regulator n=2 Tax=Xylanimonas oleitrophica TaxID=2607479 RepID=A0A2W5YET2_9MICO|nr:LuxR family transcriptional regulator [Xylanimonas oleitrophica]
MLDPATADDVAARLSQDVDLVRAALGRLEAAGLVQPARDRLTWSPAPPELVLSPLLEHSRDRLRQAETHVADLVDLYHRERASRAGVERVELVEGLEAQAHRLVELEASARRTVRAFQSGANRAVPVSTTFDPADAAEQPRVAGTPSQERTGTGPRTAPAGATDAPGSREVPVASVRTRTRPGVAYRIVVDSAFLAEPAAVTALERRMAEGAEIRVVDERLVKLAIADDEVALVQLSPHLAVLLRRPLLLLADELFESVWRTARPYLAATSTLAAQDRLILQLMLSGLTDAAMAAQVGTSARTVQRRLRALMDRAGVSTRTQLGSHAARHGWV